MALDAHDAGLKVFDRRHHQFEIQVTPNTFESDMSCQPTRVDVLEMD